MKNRFRAKQVAVALLVVGALSAGAALTVPNTIYFEAMTTQYRDYVEVADARKVGALVSERPEVSALPCLANDFRGPSRTNP